MRLTDKNTVLTDLKKQWKQTPDCCSSIQSFKRDRMVTVVKSGEAYELREDGFIRRTETGMTQRECLALLKKVFQYEFRNSHKLYVGTRMERGRWGGVDGT